MAAWTVRERIHGAACVQPEGGPGPAAVPPVSPLAQPGTGGRWRCPMGRATARPGAPCPPWGHGRAVPARARPYSPPEVAISCRSRNAVHGGLGSQRGARAWLGPAGPRLPLTPQLLKQHRLSRHRARSIDCRRRRGLSAPSLPPRPAATCIWRDEPVNRTSRTHPWPIFCETVAHPLSHARRGKDVT